MDARKGRPQRRNVSPELAPHLERIWKGFNDLCTCRPAAMGGVLPIPWTAADRYAEQHALDASRFWSLLQSMDAVYLQHANKPADP